MIRRTPDERLPLPESLQRLVDAAPRTTTEEFDDYFREVVRSAWPDPAVQARAAYVYLDDAGFASAERVPEAIRRDVDFFAAEMRALRGQLAGMWKLDQAFEEYLREAIPDGQAEDGLSPEQLREFARVNFYDPDEFEPKSNSEGMSATTAKRVLDLVTRFETVRLN